MSERILTTYIWSKAVVSVLCLLVLVAIALFPIVTRPYDIINAANAQAARGQRMVKDALLLEYIPSSQLTLRTTALSELQDSLPLFESEENALTRLHRADLMVIVNQLASDYTPMDIATRMILAHTDSPIDPLQVAILLQHERPYSVGISQMITLALQDLDDIHQLIFTIAVVILAVLALIAGVDPFVMRSYVRRDKKGNTP